MNDKNKRILLLPPKANAISIGIYLVVLLIVPSLLTNYFDKEVANNIKIILYIILAVMLAGTALQYVLIYLEPANTSNSASESLSSTSEAVPEQVGEIGDKTKNTETTGFDKKKNNKEPKESLKLPFGQKFITGLEEIRDRLYKETNNLARRANINLLIGITITMLTLVGIIFILPLDLKELYTDKKYLSAIAPENYGWTITAHFIPRLSLIIFAQLFAYFFLRLYKNGLDDIKYYQNEITNVELKVSALKVALDTKDYKNNEILKLVIEEMAKVERNFILKKDETTAELEKIKLENLNSKDLLAHVITLLETKK